MIKKIIFTLVSLLSLSWAIATVNINTASIEELMTLKGIGKVKAEAIINYRQAHNGFKNIQEIMQIKGIGVKTFEKFQNDIAIDSQISKPTYSKVGDNKHKEARPAVSAIKK